MPLRANEVSEAISEAEEIASLGFDITGLSPARSHMLLVFVIARHNP
jgi:hypothetical protein